MSRTVIFGWIASVAGMGIWVYGYFTTGYPSLVDWNSHTPGWIASYMLNVECEIGMLLAFAGTGSVYWPRT